MQALMLAAMATSDHHKQGGLVLCTWLGLTPDGQARVTEPDGHEALALCLDCAQSGLLRATSGDQVLLARLAGSDLLVVLGVVGPCLPQAAPDVLHIEAQSQLSFRCGEATLEMRDDGRVLLKGEDVTIHAKGTQRIRAGTVAIN
jgi:hypothetical protein